MKRLYVLKRIGVLLAFLLVLIAPGVAYAAGPWTMTVTVVGSGSVASTPAGIACPTDCTESYVDGTSVDLLATPSAGWTFTSWAGSVCTGQSPANPCTGIPMTNTRSITATFTQTSGGTPPLVVVFMENHSWTQISGDPDMPWLNGFVAQGRRFTNYKEGSTTGPSLPDYLQMSAGSSCGKTTDSVTFSDASITSAGCPTTVWNQLETAGKSWGVYAEGMPSVCYAQTPFNDSVTDGQYVLKHNPAPMYESIADNSALCNAHSLPFSSFSTTSMRDVSFIAPNLCDDMHGQSSGGGHANCVTNSNGLESRSDTWLSNNVQPIVDAGATVLVTFDEQGTLYAVVAGSGITAGSTDGAAYTHYNLLAGIEDRFGLSRLNNAAGKTPLPLT